MDLVVAQKVTGRVKPFGRVPISAMVIDRDGRRQEFKRISKEKLARYLLLRVQEILLLKGR